MPWEHCFDVPGQEAIDESIYKHHDDDVHHGEVVACHGAVPDVVPLYPHRLLLKLGNLKAAKTKRNAGGQALVMDINNRDTCLQNWGDHVNRMIKKAKVMDIYLMDCQDLSYNIDQSQ